GGRSRSCRAVEVGLAVRSIRADNQHMADAQAVEISQLRVRRGKNRVFDGLDVSIARGQITGLLGPSGCGKTTLMRAVVGVQGTEAGTVTVLGQPAGARQLRRMAAYGTQGAADYDDLTVRQNLRYIAALL